MKILLNDIEKSVNTGTTIQELLQSLGQTSRQGTAIAVNEKIIPSEKWQVTVVQEHDRILMVEAIQGG